VRANRGAIHDVEPSRLDPAESRNALWDMIGAQLMLASLGGPPPVVEGKWEIERVLGRGGFGLVCAARDSRLPRQVAIKLLPHGPELVFLMREARSLARLEHPAIVTIFDVGEGVVRCGERSLPCGWIAMQLVAGDTLDGWVRKARPRAAAVVETVVTVGRALAHAHAEGVLHRDLKPANIMIDGRGRPFVIDFGLAIASTAGTTSDRVGGEPPAADALGERATAAGDVRGTPSYMAPEAVGGRSTAASDQFALAVVAWEALFGVHPWSTDHQPASPAGAIRIEPWQRERLVPVLERGMASMPSGRFVSIDAFCDALASAVSRRWRRRVASVGIVATLVAGGLVGGTYGVSWAERRSTKETPEDAPMVGPRPAAPACGGLAAWAGHWSLMGRVVWTEYSNQLVQVRPIGLNVELLSGCDVRVRMDKFLPTDEGKTGEFLAGETRVTPTRMEDGAWSLVYDLDFPGDRRTYGEKEHHEFALTLDRSPDGEPQVHGAFAKVQTAGGLILRKGWVLGGRERSPTLEEVDAHQFPCDARCRIHCAGDDATEACIERGCAPYAEPLADPCGPPSSDFVAPLRTRSERRQLRKGKPFGTVTTGKPGDCEENAKRVRGHWRLWRVTEAGPVLASLDVVPQGCLLQASLHVAGTDDVSMSGEITAMGIWTLAPDSLALGPQTMVLAGTGPAFGIDLVEPGHLLRAFRP